MTYFIYCAHWWIRTPSINADQNPGIDRNTSQLVLIDIGINTAILIGVYQWSRESWWMCVHVTHPWHQGESQSKPVQLGDCVDLLLLLLVFLPLLAGTLCGFHPSSMSLTLMTRVKVMETHPSVLCSLWSCASARSTRLINIWFSRWKKLTPKTLDERSTIIVMYISKA